ncbi:hypothetical protein MPER_06703, partial [Moniliophthora perniciosa FA553]
NASTSLSIHLAHAISYLTSCLHGLIAPCNITKLQLVLEAEPHRLLRTPLACVASGVQWFDWINALGAQEFDFFVDTGCVSVRIGKKGDPSCRLATVWADELPSPTVAPLPFKPSGGKTIAQQLMEYDDDSEHMFAMIAHETSPTTTWMSSILDQFPSNKHSASRRERARQARVFIDTTKTEVTAYEGGRTTVLTGGVMLGGAPSKSKKAIPKPFQSASAMDWRAARV